MTKNTLSEIELLKASLQGQTPAFEVIVKKYQSLICAITYSATGSVDKSEELAQQAFVKCWKNLGQLKDLTKFRAWLCSIARHAISDSYRRQKNDITSKAIPMDSIQEHPSEDTGPVETAISKERESIVNEALSKIPDTFREPLVLYYREERSYRQVADQLGFSEHTARQRISRARSLLREKVASLVEETIERTKPGKVFTTAVIASIAGLAIKGSGVAAVAGIGAATTTTGTATGVAGVMSGVTAKIITAAAVAAIGVGAVITYKHITKPEQGPDLSQAAMVVHEQEEEQVVRKEQSDEVDNIVSTAAVKIESRLDEQRQTIQLRDVIESEAVTVTAQEEVIAEVNEIIKSKGVVVDLDGLPIANAKVVLYHNIRQWGLGNRVVEETMSDANGRFEFESPINFTQSTKRSNAQDLYVLLATHPDYAFGWQYLRQGQELESYELILTAPISRIITVTDHENKPLAGVRVWPYNVGDRTSGEPSFRDYLKLDTDIGLIGSTTDTTGQATITNLPKTRCSFHATLEGYATGLAFSGGKQIRLSKGVNVYGRVLADNDEPVKGATVRFYTNWMWQFFLAKTDAEGNFVFKDLPAKGWDMSPWGRGEYADGLYKVTVEHETFSVPEEEVELLPGEDITDFIMYAYSDGTLIKCTVIEADTNMPVIGARIQGSSEAGRIDGSSDLQGLFTVRVEPGPTTLFFTSPPDGVYVLEGQNLPESTLRFEAQGKEMEVVLKMPPIAGQLINVPGYVIGPNDIGESDAVVYSQADQRFHTSTAGSYVRSAGTDYDGLFELKEVPAGLKLHVYAEAKNRTLAGTGVFEVPADPNETTNIEINLKPTQSSKLIIRDKNGEAVCDTSLEMRPVIGDQNVWGGYNRVVRTDSEGFFQADGILPGLEYYLRDIRFDQSRVSVEDREKWFKGRITLIPLDSEPPLEPTVEEGI
ncbi:MAG: sigma-70 family RNA polymerase sigma factor [Planctomycetota bacterium]